MVTVKRALLSCSDKTGLDTFSKELAALGVELIASGGTAEFLTKQGLRVKTVEEFAGITEELDGRVKTLHPKIHAGILARRDDPAHVRSVGKQGLIDLVVINLYPFEQTTQQPGVSLAEAVEQIDVGGVALLRAAAKNFSHVAVVCQPSQYHEVAAALRQGKGQLQEPFAHRLAVAAFALTSRYDTTIAGFLDADQRRADVSGPRQQLPDTATTAVRRHQTLRYGENPHQQGAWYIPTTGMAWGIATLTQHQGKELSYNNLLDVDAAVRCLLDFGEPACAIIKHHSQCGLAVAASTLQAYELAYACDAESAFGGVVGFNRPVDAATAARLCATFLEVVAAPSLEPTAFQALAKKPALRVVTLDWPSHRPVELEWRHLLGSWLLQEPDHATVVETMKAVTKRALTSREHDDLLFAWIAAKHVKSNGIVIAKDRATVGIGQGQPSRVGSVRLALVQASERARGAVAASDGFFPFPDSVELLAKAGVTAIIQPGGSIRDHEVIAAADAANVAMVVTGIRHFRH